MVSADCSNILKSQLMLYDKPALPKLPYARYPFIILIQSLCVQYIVSMRRALVGFVRFQIGARVRHLVVLQVC